MNEQHTITLFRCKFEFESYLNKYKLLLLKKTHSSHHHPYSNSIYHTQASIDYYYYLWDATFLPNNPRLYVFNATDLTRL